MAHICASKLSSPWNVTEKWVTALQTLTYKNGSGEQVLPQGLYGCHAEAGLSNGHT